MEEPVKFRMFPFPCTILILVPSPSSAPSPLVPSLFQSQFPLPPYNKHLVRTILNLPINAKGFSCGFPPTHSLSHKYSDYVMLVRDSENDGSVLASSCFLFPFLVICNFSQECFEQNELNSPITKIPKICSCGREYHPFDK